MSTNPLKNADQSPGHVPWTAMQFYHRAVETGKGDLAALWFAEARKRGEVIDPSEVRI